MAGENHDEQGLNRGEKGDGAEDFFWPLFFVIVAVGSKEEEESRGGKKPFIPLSSFPSSPYRLQWLPSANVVVDDQSDSLYFFPRSLTARAKPPKATETTKETKTTKETRLSARRLLKAISIALLALFGHLGHNGVGRRGDFPFFAPREHVRAHADSFK